MNMVEMEKMVDIGTGSHIFKINKMCYRDG
ncbi:MAG: hypothetical protein JWR50_1073 [Mucilaginibacter sp.]|nr:hypothetical protein [Mucilaginibacter sp.]